MDDPVQGGDVPRLRKVGSNRQGRGRLVRCPICGTRWTAWVRNRQRPERLPTEDTKRPAPSWVEVKNSSSGFDLSLIVGNETGVVRSVNRCRHRECS
jgi:hypothetical protein